MKIRLGLNTGFALNRFTTPEEWIPLVSEKFGIKNVQFTADLLNPALPENIVNDEIEKIDVLNEKYGVKINCTFTSAFTRVNHLAHPDKQMREYWLGWFKSFIDISKRLGAESVGSHLGILTVRDDKDRSIRSKRLEDLSIYWNKLADYAADKGMKYLSWEPMSISREFGHTVKEARFIQNLLNEKASIPIKLCYDVDHGDVSSLDPHDTDPYYWIKEFSSDIGLIHLKQTLKDKGGHWPFTNKYNTNGKITPKKLIKALESAGIEEMDLLLELSFREREPFESQVIDDIKESVEYWKEFVDLD